ncbi:hypothetical protein [uncultured Clostridium sp.]|uniref:hypothetical protein n=1 Tax=uncultured Clostridium sp. TaxID=59620 RepID=UPI0028E5E623|nr:hypothetical protein [uncultured Clostridium sp.]
MINIKGYSEEIEQYKSKKNIYAELTELKDCYLGANSKNRSEEEIYKIAISMLAKLFNPLQLYSEPIIPLSFLETNIGKTLLSIINENENRVLTIKDIVEMSKTQNNKKGYSYQYINKEIKEGRLTATMYNGRWQITYEDAITFLKKKKIF